MTDQPRATPEVRDRKGRFVSVFCDDPNCDGKLTRNSIFGDEVWMCDGLTFRDQSGTLFACERTIDA